MKTPDLREEIYKISLTPINQIYYVPPGMDGEIGLDGKQIDQLLNLFQSEHKNLLQGLLDRLPKVIAGCCEHPLGDENCERWYACPGIYRHNEVITEFKALIKEEMERI